MGKTWLSGASAKNKPEGKSLCLDASLGYVGQFFLLFFLMSHINDQCPMHIKVNIFCGLTKKSKAVIKLRLEI